ncbi:hypothetical protein CHH28_12660 [Bacterioplanes sanyensis]|uniref:Outer membrane protein n=1 Tax=Bacterioplanes sanyensis TaxID=1249553 RepID=A0A222FLC7_9GAMM|nr:TIGR04219 family outer membrane beta-barrel protein [Bacterioplanes sanyensis]ASP39472.1 hypothetical protein CHH28_12660 [Bacterioplanes sanyensis]
MQRINRWAMLAALGVCTAVPAQADLLFTVGAKASVWNAGADGDLDKDVSVGSDGLDIEDNTGNQLTVFFEHPVPLLPHVELKRTSLDMSGEGSINAEFAGQDFTGDVETEFDLSHQDLTLYWGLPLPVPFVDVYVGATARQFDGSAEVSGSYQGNTVSESVDLDLTLPLAYGAVKVSTPFGLYAGADVRYIGMGDNQLTDLSYGLGYDLPIPVVDIGLQAGYRRLALQTDPDDVDIEADVDVSGVYVGAAVSLGF